MGRPLILPLPQCTDPDLVGGKAVGLARLSADGFAVPPGVCVTTEAYVHCLQSSGFSTTDEWRKIRGQSGAQREAVLAACQSRIMQADLSSLAMAWSAHLRPLTQPGQRWAVRSSATNEDATMRSYAGLYRTELGVPYDDIPAALKNLWASLWHDRVVQYLLRSGPSAVPPAMAVVMQPMLEAETSGVAYSIHPLKGRDDQVAINAVLGLAAPLVDGQVIPDHYVVHMNRDGTPVTIRKRLLADKPTRLVVGQEGLRSDPIPEASRTTSSLSDDQVFEVARVAKRIERAFGRPVDIEWVFDATQLWIVQARPITVVPPPSTLTNDDCEWTRANLKETMPDVPSPMGLSFLQYFMDGYIVSRYRRLGCRIPEGVSSVRVLHGRPYLNATLFYSLVGQLGGEPSLNVEQMGGVPLLSPPSVSRIGWLAFVRAGWLMWREMRRGEKNGPLWFAEMKRLAVSYHPDRVRSLTLEESAAHLDALGRWLAGREVTFGIVGGVGQCLQALSRLLPRWLGEDWRSLFNAALQGQGTVISAQQIVRLAALVQVARADTTVREWFLSEPWDPSDFRTQLHGTAFLRAFEHYLAEYGHRAVGGESDIMSPRMAEQPGAILGVLRTQLRVPGSLDPAALLARQRRCREEALAEIRRRVGWRWDRWAIFQWWYRRLTRFLALREANRHHLMYYSTAVRHLLLRLGDLLAAEGQIDKADDIFFVTLEEQGALLARTRTDWKTLIDTRRAECARHAARQVPDTISDWEQAGAGLAESSDRDSADLLRGLPISVGCVRGPIRLIRSPADWRLVAPGDILVAPVIDPGMAPLFGIAGGLIVEMGGTLSHGAIIAREYGIPTVANVSGAMTRLLSGQQVLLDAGAGTIAKEQHDHIRNPQ